MFHEFEEAFPRLLICHELEDAVDRVAEERTVHVHRVALHDAQVLQPCNAVLHGLARHEDFLAQLCHRNASVLSKGVDDFHIRLIQFLRNHLPHSFLPRSLKKTRH